MSTIEVSEELHCLLWDLANHVAIQPKRFRRKAWTDTYMLILVEIYKQQLLSDLRKVKKVQA